MSRSAEKHVSSGVAVSRYVIHQSTEGSSEYVFTSICNSIHVSQAHDFEFDQLLVEY